MNMRREPDQVIGGRENPYLLRWWIVPRNRFFNIYLHRFLRSDDERALHDHPWWNVSVLLSGRYLEHMPSGVKLRRRGCVVLRRATAAHRIELLADGRDPRGRGPVWTLFLTGPKVRSWGFHCPQGWRHWRVFTNPVDGGATVGKGCDD